MEDLQLLISNTVWLRLLLEVNC